MHKCDCAFLLISTITATERMTCKNQRSAYFSLRALTTHTNERQDLRGYRTKGHQFFSCGIFFIDGDNATIRVAIRPPVVE